MPESTQSNSATMHEAWESSGHQSIEDQDNIHLGPILLAIRRGWKWPIAVAGGFAFISIIHVLLSAPMFRASGTLYLAQSEKAQAGASGATGGISLLSELLPQGASMETQVEIIGSRDMIRQALLASGINTQIWQSNSQEPQFNYAEWKFGGQSLSLYAPGPKALRALYAHVTDSALEGKVLDLRFLAGGNYQISYHGNTLLVGRLGQPAVGADLRMVLKPEQPGYLPAVNAHYKLRIENAITVYKSLMSSGAISVTRGTGRETDAAKASYLVTVSANDTNPYVARRLTNALMQTYLTQTRSWSTDQAGATYTYLSGQLDKIRSALTHADARLGDYQSKSGVIAVSAGASALIKQLADFETQRSQDKMTLYGLQQIQNTLAQPRSVVNPYLFSSKDPVLDGLSTRLADAESKLTALRKQYTEKAPQVVEAEADIASIRSAISTLIHNQKEIAKQRLQSINTVIHQHEAQMSKYPQSELRVISLNRATEVLGKLYMFLMEKQEEAAISKASTLTKNRVLDTALVDAQPISPNAKKDVILYAFLGLLIGLGVVIGRYLLLPGFRSEEELRRSYPFLPVYGLLPVTQLAERDKQDGLIMPGPRSNYGEALRLLRGNLYLALADDKRQGQMVGFTSAIPGDGKSTLAYQMAVALAQDGKKVILVDADLRSPHAHLAFDVAQDPGLIGVLAARSTWQESLHQIPDLGVDLLTAGTTPPNPSEHLGSNRLEEIFNEMRAHYDYILVDTPPFPLVGDLLTIAPRLDRLLTVATINHTPRRAYQKHLQGLLGLHLPIGLVINGVPKQGDYGYGYGYGEGSEGDHLSGPKAWRQYLQEWLQRWAKR